MHLNKLVALFLCAINTIMKSYVVDLHPRIVSLTIRLLLLERTVAGYSLILKKHNAEKL